ncbi:transposase [Mucilaginibacter conchicola]|uniref:Transposase n=1 Tax=Mucilaginibacter conchicola TaxID=2303333 RepID=A0A372NXM8_9SPHI|nr:transposase [Mucilaginibacter conchicola]RFZ94866.1 transposase [Mucilaginibacter conchicola]
MKIVKHYPDELKLKLVRHYLDSDEGYKKTAERFNVPYAAMVMRWVRKFIGESTTQPGMSKPAKKEKPIDPGDAETMAKRIQELEQALENERLRSQAMSTMIDVAERDLKISIRKKSGAKRSGK